MKPRWFAILLGSALIGAACFAIFFAVSYLSIDRDASPSVERVREAFRKGQLVTDPYQEGSTGIGSHQWNDCLITLMAIDQRGDRLRLALSPIIAGVPNPPPDGNPCGVLASLVNGATPGFSPADARAGCVVTDIAWNPALATAPVSLAGPPLHEGK